MEKQLIDQIQQGDKEAFKKLYDHYAEYALRVATAITKSSAFAADAVQETFIRVYRNIHAFERGKPFKPWFYRILINECNRFLEQKRKLIPVDFQWDQEPKLVQSDRVPIEQYEDLYEAIGKLQDLYRIPIILKYLNELTEKEIADLMDLNVNTVKSRLLKGRQLLKDELQERTAKEGTSCGRP
ncbi:sigma-70 family RNA polymerase sigma factor [Cohnella lubricantis]|uniref:Sigma-70 family RNA polymerase sigma factor n=1 Tax=Cohnella lubricantis TaxID=2163172 RepID=A0A841TEZ9_9BACL|nr:sigma-70 family RNA polymerase sigma factor [Cohnella lubricantis]